MYNIYNSLSIYNIHYLLLIHFAAVGSDPVSALQPSTHLA